MQKAEYDKMFQMEQTHWFFTAKRNFVKAFCSNLLPPGRERLILDAGCGTGANHLFLRNYGQVTSIDFSPDALAYCRQRALRRLVRGDLNQPGFKTAAFDCVAALDVLYHSWIVDDRKVLADFFHLLKPGGRLLITDSAFPFLVSRHDQAVMTRERYTIASLAGKLRNAGFNILRASYMFMSTFPLLAAVRILQKHNGASPPQPAASNVFALPGPLNTLLISALQLEAGLLRLCKLPFGSSLIIMAEKPAAPIPEP